MLKKIKIIIACLCLSACTFQPINIDIQATPERDEKAASILEERIGSSGYYYMVFNYKLVDDVKAINRLDRIGARIAAFTERPQIHYRFFIIDAEYHNVFALPNGYILFTKAFIQDVDQEDILAAVIAHEIAHVTHKHSLTEFIRRMGKSPSTVIGEKVFKLATDSHVSQVLELQADQTGMRYLYRAGYDPKAFAHLMNKLKIFGEEDEVKLKKKRKENPKDDIELDEDLVPSHPYIENRIVNARHFVHEVIKTEEVKYDPEQFRF